MRVLRMSLHVIDRGKIFHEMTFMMLISLLSDGAHKLCQAPVLLKDLSESLVAYNPRCLQSLRAFKS